MLHVREQEKHSGKSRTSIWNSKSRFCRNSAKISPVFVAGIEPDDLKLDRGRIFRPKMGQNGQIRAKKWPACEMRTVHGKIVK